MHRDSRSDNLRKPVVFLHGFLGDKEDWKDVLPCIERKCICLNLSPSLELLIAQLDAQGIDACDLVGYSMGGRIALQLKKAFPTRIQQVIALSAHPGLKTKEEKRKRWESDLNWIKTLQTKHFEEFLDLWYKQPLFKSFCNKETVFKKILKKRKVQDAEMAANLLKVFSLAHQEFFLPEDTHFLCGSEDAKFLELYRTLLPINQYTIIEGAGHVMHLEAPKTCGETIWKMLTGKNVETTRTLGSTSGMG